MRKKSRKAAIVLFWLAVWQALAVICHNSLAMVGPLETAEALASLCVSGEFWLTAACSLLRVSGGFLAAWICGILFAVLASRVPLAEEILAPVVSLMKSVPVASFVVLALIILGSDKLTFLIVFLISAPITYLNTLTGLKSADPSMREMAQMFRLGGWRRLRYIELPAAAPFLLSAGKITVGMSFKAGAAAEIIGVPLHSVGEKLYMAKIYLETADLFAWTAVIIVGSLICEKAVTALLRRVLLSLGADVPESGGRRKGRKA